MILAQKMGALESNQGERFMLWSDHLVGRAPDAALRVDHHSISWRHAGLRWTGKYWELQDLGSLNGTFLDDRRLEPGSRTLLRLGAHLRFGEYPVIFELIDDEPPRACAVARDTGERVLMRDGLIGLPNAEEPVCTIYRDGDGRWIAEDSTGAKETHREDILVVDGRQFRFEPGGVVYATSASRHSDLRLSSVNLEFEVSRNEEHVAVTIVYGSRRLPLRPRAHSYMLLTLARLRLQDQAENRYAAAAHGWVDQEHLLRMLATTPSQLALDIYRARRQFGEAGIANSAQLIERRPDSRELRLGVERLAVQSLSE